MAFEIILKHSSEITPAEDAQIDIVDQLAYGSNHSAEISEDPPTEWSSSDTCVLGILDGSIVSLVWVLYRVIFVGGKSIPVGGIGGVATHPEFQRRGFAEALMRRAESYLRDELKVPFGLLVCSEIREKYYSKLGWQTVAGPMMFDVAGGKRQWNEQIMVLPLAGETWPLGIIDLRGKPW